MADDQVPRPTLAFERKAEPAKRWSPIELLEEFLAGVKSGTIVPTNVMVFYCEADPDGRLRPHYWTANVSHVEQIGFGELMTQMAVEEWRG